MLDCELEGDVVHDLQTLVFFVEAMNPARFREKRPDLWMLAGCILRNLPSSNSHQYAGVLFSTFDVESWVWLEFLQNSWI